MPIHRDPAGRSTVIAKALPKGLLDPAMLERVRESVRVRTQLRAAGRSAPETWALVGFVQEGFPTPIREFRAFPPRRWRFDLAWPEPYKIAVEIDGGVYTLGRHTRGAGFEADCRKMNTAAASGWIIFHVTPMMLYKEWPEIVRVLRAAFALRKGADAGTRA